MNKVSQKWSLLLLCILVFACEKTTPKHFKLIGSEQSNIDFKNTLSPTSTLNILDYMYFYNGGGVAVGDINKIGIRV